VSLTSQRRKRSQIRLILVESNDFHAFLRDLLHAANLRHGTDGFTSPTKKDVLRIFFCALKGTKVPKARALPLDHRSPLFVL
jgi:hypothetical protein